MFHSKSQGHVLTAVNFPAMWERNIFTKLQSLEVKESCLSKVLFTPPITSVQHSWISISWWNSSRIAILYWLEVLIGLKVIELPATVKTAFEAKLIFIYLCVCVCWSLCVYLRCVFFSNMLPNLNLHYFRPQLLEQIPFLYPKTTFWSPKLLPHWDRRMSNLRLTKNSSSS